jgi:hypothetical protein
MILRPPRGTGEVGLSAMGKRSGFTREILYAYSGRNAAIDAITRSLKR